MIFAIQVLPSVSPPSQQFLASTLPRAFTFSDKAFLDLFQRSSAPKIPPGSGSQRESTETIIDLPILGNAHPMVNIQPDLTYRSNVISIRLKPKSSERRKRCPVRVVSAGTIATAWILHYHTARSLSFYQNITSIPKDGTGQRKRETYINGTSAISWAFSALLFHCDTTAYRLCGPRRHSLTNGLSLSLGYSLPTYDTYISTLAHARNLAQSWQLSLWIDQSGRAWHAHIALPALSFHLTPTNNRPRWQYRWWRYDGAGSIFVCMVYTT